MYRHIGTAIWAVGLIALERALEMKWPNVSAITWWSVAAALFVLGLLVVYLPVWWSWWSKSRRTRPAPQTEDSGPNWTMPELVRHVRSTGIVVPCMREIEDKARRGQLAFWGRKFSVASPHENPNPLKPIATDHWDHYCLDAIRCAYAEDTSTCCTEPRSPNLSEHGYTDSFQDLRANQAQATALWRSGGGDDVSG